MRRRPVFALAAGVLATALAFAVVRDDAETERLVETLDVDPGEVFADVGAGDGRFAVALARVVGERGRIYATEVDPKDLETIRDRLRDEKVDNVSVVAGTQRDTGLPKDCCDGILLRRVYHHFQDPAAMRASLARALKDGGLILVVDFDTKGWSRPEGIPDSRTGHGIPKAMLVKEMEGAGFHLMEDVDWQGSDYALLFREEP